MRWDQWLPVFLSVPYTQLYYQSLEIDKCQALRNNQDNFDAKMTISHQADSVEGTKIYFMEA